MAPCTVWPSLPQDMQMANVYEFGVSVGAKATHRKFPPPEGYVNFEKKIQVYKWYGFKPPPRWGGYSPRPIDFAMVGRMPPAIPAWHEQNGDVDPLHPAGAGWYGVVIMHTSPKSELYQAGVTSIIPCKEQLLNRYTSIAVEAWTAGMVSVCAEETDSVVGDGRSDWDRNGNWLTADDEYNDYDDYEAEDYDAEEESAPMAGHGDGDGVLDPIPSGDEEEVPSETEAEVEDPVDTPSAPSTWRVPWRWGRN